MNRGISQLGLKASQMVYGNFVGNYLLTILEDKESLESTLDLIYIFSEALISNFQFSKT